MVPRDGALVLQLYRPEVGQPRPPPRLLLLVPHGPVAALLSVAVLRAAPGPGQRGPARAALARVPCVAKAVRLAPGRVGVPGRPGVPGPRPRGFHRALVVHARVGAAAGRAGDDPRGLVRLLLLGLVVLAQGCGVRAAAEEGGWRASNRRHTLGAFTAQLRAALHVSHMEGWAGWTRGGGRSKNNPRSE